MALAILAGVTVNRFFLKGILQRPTLGAKIIWERLRLYTSKWKMNNGLRNEARGAIYFVPE